VKTRTAPYGLDDDDEEDDADDTGDNDDDVTVMTRTAPDSIGI